jgi:hypothetical protein
MRGIHTIYSTNGRYKKFYYFELLQLILSSLTWRKYNGDINLYCDDNFREVIDELDISWLWDSIDYDSLDKVPKDIDTELFWTYPKMFVHSIQKQPFCSLDADLYVTVPITDFKEDVVFAHKEVDLHEFTYPNIYDLELFRDTFQGRVLDDDAINTSLILFNRLDVLESLMDITNQFVRNKYTKFFEFTSTQWTIYCEQKLLATLIKEQGYSERSILPITYDCFDWQKNLREFIPTKWGISHLWFMKDIIKNDDYQRLMKTTSLLKEIEVNFPEHLEKTKYLMKYCLE